VRKLRAVVVLSILLGAVAAQASITESFTASGGWLIDWGLSVVLDSGWAAGSSSGRHLSFNHGGTSLAGEGFYLYDGLEVYYNVSDYNKLPSASDNEPSGGELYDIEALLAAYDAATNDWYVMGITSHGSRENNTVIGDLAINVEDSWEWGSTYGTITSGLNTSELGIKLGGKQAGHVEANPDWGYGWDGRDLYGADRRNPWTDNGTNYGGTDPTKSSKRTQGYKPGVNTDQVWGSNYVYGSGDSSWELAGDQFTGLNPIFGTWGDGSGSSSKTYAFAVNIDGNWLSNGIQNVSWTESCLNDDGRLKTPEPATAALLAVAGAGLVARRVRRRSQ